MTGWLVTLLIVAGQAMAGDQQLNALFTEAKVNGSLVITTLDGDERYVHDPQRAAKRYWPASTFKVPNTLIALDAGVVDNADSPIKWNGQKTGRKAWDQDQTLASAFVRSCVWCYQRFARQVGDSAYRQYLSSIDYGNKHTGKDVDRFWLEGDLAISIDEQIDFLGRLYRQQLPFKAEHYAVLKQIMLVEQTVDYKLYAKTGWAQPPEGDHGWYVGYVERGNAVWLFAMNIDIHSYEDAKKRVALTRQALAAKGII